MGFLARLALCSLALFAPAAFPASPAAGEAAPQIQFVREYIRQLGELERLRIRVEEVLQQPDANHMMEMISYSSRVQIAMRSYIGQLKNLRLEPPHDVLVANLVSLHSSRHRVHGRIAEISTAMLARPAAGGDAGAMANEVPQLRSVLDEMDALFPNLSVLAFTTLISPTPDASGETSRLRITAAEREALLDNLRGEFDGALDVPDLKPLANAAWVLRGYLLKDFTPADSQ
jgi:hypothetical protein